MVNVEGMESFILRAFMVLLPLVITRGLELNLLSPFFLISSVLSIYKLFCDFSDVNYPENHDETSCFADNINKF